MKNYFVFVFLLFEIWFSSSCSAENRIISLMPSQTEMLFSLGFGESLVGVSDFCNYPPEVASLPKVGGMELNLEKVATLKPTIIMDLDGMHRRYDLIFQQIGLKVRNYQIKRLSDVPLTAKTIAEDLGNPERGVEFLKKWEESIAALPKPGAIMPRVYVEIWDAPIQGAAPTSFIGEMVEKAGGKNIFAGNNSPFPVVTSEEIIKFNPEIILIAYPLENLEKIANRPGWTDITAVRRGNLKSLDLDIYVRPGPRCIEAIRKLSDYFRSVR